MKDDRPSVQSRCHEVDGRTGNAHAMHKRLTLGIQSRKRREQRRVDVEDAIRKGVQQRRPDKAHESGETHEGHSARLQRTRDRGVVNPAVRIVARIEEEGLDGRGAGALQPCGVRSIRNHDLE